MIDAQRPDAAPAPRRPRPRPVRILFWGLGSAAIFLLVVPVLLALAVLVLADSAGGRDWIGRQIATATVGTDTALTIGAIDPGLPGTFALRRLAIADAEGTWLTADSLRIDWNPWALLRAKVRIDSLTGRGIALLRLPDSAAAEPEPAAPFDPRRLLPDLPVAISVGEIDLQQVTIAEPVVGVAAILDARASATLARADGAAAMVDIRRTDGVQGRLQARVDVRPDASGDRLDLDAVLEEPPGGLIAAMAGWPDIAPVSLQITGQGSLQALDGRIEGAIGDLAWVKGSYQTSLGGSAGDKRSDGAVDLSADLTAEIAALLDDDMRPLAAGPLSLQFTLRSEEEGSAIRLDHLALEGAALSLSASADVDLGRDTLRGNLLLDRLEAGALRGLLPDVELQQPRLLAQVTGSLARPQVELHVDADLLGLPDMALHDLALQAGIRPLGEVTGADLPAFDLTATGTVARVRLIDMEAAQTVLDNGLSLRLAGQVDPAAERLRLDNAEIAMGRLTLDAEGDVGPRGPLRLQAKLAAPDLAAPDLAALAAAFGLRLTGGLEADLSLAGSDLLADEPGEWTAGLTAAVTQFGYDGLPLQPLLGDRVTVTAQAGGRGFAAIDLSRLTLTGQAIDVDGSGRIDLDRGEVAAKLEIDLPALMALSELAGTEMSGRAAIAIDLSGPLEGAAFQARLTLTDATLAGTPVQTAVVDVDIARLQDPLRTSLRLDGLAMELPLRLRTDLAIAAAGERLLLEGIQADLAGVQIGGRLELDLDSTIATGTLQASAPDLAVLAAPFGVTAAGQLDGTLVLSPREGVQGLVVDLNLAGLQEAESGLAVETVEAAIDLVLAPAGPRGTARIALRGAEAGKARLDLLTIRAEGDLASRMQLVLDGSGTVDLAGLPQPLELAAQAELQGLPPDLRAEVSRMRLDLSDRSLVQDGSAIVTVTADGGAIDSLRLLAQGGSISLTARMAPDGIDVDLDADDLPLELASLLVDDMPVTGTVGMTADLRLRTGQPQGNAVLSVSELRSTREDLVDLEPAQVRLQADLDGTALRLNAGWQAPGTEPGRFVLTVPMRTPPARLLPEPAGSAPLQGRLDWSGHLDQLVLFLPGADSEIAGRFVADLSIGGILDEPLASGSIAIDDGSYGNYTTGTIVRDIQARVEGRADSRLEVTASATDGDGGRLDVTGHVDLGGDPLPTFELALSAQRFTAARLDLATGAISANLTAAGTPLRNRIEGDVRVDSLDVEISGGLPPSAIVIPVTVIPRPGAAPLNPPQPRGNDRPARSALDITVTIPPQMTVSGRGLDSVWSGVLQVRGSTTNPMITGQITAVRGSFNLVGKRFNLSQGVIAFDGSRPPNPNLTIIFTYSGEQATANVEVRGTANAPQVNLTSTPPMPEGDIISAVLFNRRSSQLSPAEALDVATSLAAITGQGNPGQGITTQLRQALGLDVLSLGSDTSGRPTLNAGRYLTDDVYVGVRQGLGSGSSSVAVQVDLTDKLQLETDVGVDSKSSVGVNWKFDY